MGTCYYGVCHDCKQYVDLDKFGSWGMLPDIDEDFDDYKNNHWIFISLRLHAFIYEHNGHKIGIYADSDDTFYKHDFKEQFPWASDGRQKQY